MRKVFVILALMFGLTVLAPQAGAFAGERGVVPAVQFKFETPNIVKLVQARISPAQAKSIALSRVPGGEVVDIRRSGETYRVRVIASDGRVVDIIVDANTGRVR